MGCDMTTHVERQTAPGQWEEVDMPTLFDWRSYGMFGFLADVRNYSAVMPIAEPRGLPADVSSSVAEDAEGFVLTSSWLLARELAEFDYEQKMNDRRITRGGDGGVTGTPDEGTWMTYREFLGGPFLDDVARLTAVGDPGEVRLVFWFDC